MKLSTDLPISAMFFKHWHTDDTEVGVVVAKARFWRRSDGVFVVDTTPPDLILAEIFDGDPASSALLHDQDIAPGKAATDLILHAYGRSPRGALLTDWPVAVRIAHRLTYGFHLRGPAQWQRGSAGWRITSPEPVNTVPISYALAYGGITPGDSDLEPKVFAFNPVGAGFIDAARLRQADAFVAPQIGELAEFMQADPTAQMMVHGFGAIAKTWLPRRAEAGTFDAAWQQSRAPRMPRDYSLRYWNAAHRQLQFTDALRGSEVIEIAGISHHSPVVSVALPMASLAIQASGQDSLQQRMVLDTVEIDLRSDTPAEHCLALTWRCRIDAPQRFDSGELFNIPPED